MAGILSLLTVPLTSCYRQFTATHVNLVVNMEALSDEEFDHVRDWDMTESESEADSADERDQHTPSTTPRTRTPRPSDRKTIPCPWQGCSKTFNRNARLQEHIRSHTGERPFKCPHAFCPKDFLRETHLKHHLTSAHSDVRKFKCTWQGCEKGFATGTRLRRHIQAHEGQEKYRCRGYEGCNETFRKHDTLRRHITAVHEDKKPFPCDYVDPTTRAACTKAFDFQEKLKAHQRAVHDGSRFTCTICTPRHGDEDVAMTRGIDVDGHAFATFAELQAHIAEAHPPTCPHCEATFITNKELTRHLELDHGIIGESKESKEHYPCTYPDCEHVFTKQGNLNVHVKTVHEKQKDFVCGTTEIPIPEELQDQNDVNVSGCGRSFTSKATLVEHVRTEHFGLLSKRKLREQKKQAKRSAEDDVYSVGSASKRRKPRKDKGLKKSSILSSLVAGRDDQGTQQSVYAEAQNHEKSSFDDIMKEEEDDWNQLSGSMTMVGEHLYHNGRGYHLASEDGSADRARLEDVQYVPCHGDRATIFEDEPFFAFEHEPEYIHPNIDPILLRT